MEDEREAMHMVGLCMKLKFALKSTYEDVLESVSICGYVDCLTINFGHNNVPLPLLTKLKIFPTNMTTHEDLCVSI
jgi:hypothetical protein